MYNYVAVVNGLFIFMGNNMKEAIANAEYLVGGRERLYVKPGSKRVLVVEGPFGVLEVALAGRSDLVIGEGQAGLRA